MRIYLDDNTASARLAALLRKAGHDVQLPVDAGISGEDDSVHLAHAVREQRVCLTQDYVDYANLHDLAVALQGHHPGILVVRNDNNPKKDLDDYGIVRAIANLEAAGVPIADQYIILNHGR
jgi:predicted nuclease of predicted toxin-antitoxin system